MIDKGKIYPQSCPICNARTNYVHNISESKDIEAYWYSCTCGVIFQENVPEHGKYNVKYQGIYDNKNGAMEHSCRTYGPLIEELTYGRQMLDVGFAIPWNMKAFEKRGWLVWGIDINKDLKGGGNLYKGDFMTYDFSPNIPKDKLQELTGGEKIERKFDLIWMGHIFEHFNDPIAAIKKAYDLLTEDGVLYIATPDIDFINSKGVSNFGHWKKQEHYIMWSERALNREVERVGFKTVMSRRNYINRFGTWNDVHAIYQKKYF